MRFIRTYRAPCLVKSLPTTRNYSTVKKLQDVEIDKTRNIGILAHIDAGKTTTTERMLYYSGLINQMGEVHHGNTVTDFMAQERERGITITSAAVTFYWKEHQFNLIDTPGHIDFTMEVEQTLNVLDGAVVILDGSAGVEAQTLTVWRQANQYKIPRIVFVNKMDRTDADLLLSCKSIEEKLDIPVLCLQLPIRDKGKLVGLVDVLTLRKILYEKGNDKNLIRVDISENDALFETAKMARAEIVDKLTQFSDFLATNVIEKESLDDISTVDICKALRQVTLNQEAVPVLMGSAYKNIGVQPLMDSVILYLPSPIERNTHFRSFENNLAAKAFKVRHVKHKGPLVHFRVYNGDLKKGQKLYNIQQEVTETAGKLYIACADDLQEVDTVKNGNIAVVSGLKQVTSGDLVTNSQSAAHRAKSGMLKLSSKGTELEQESVENLFGSGPQIPDPVFFCSIEPPSLAYQSSLDQALTELQREDPSLRVNNDPETGQTVLSGMGELHLEIIKDRILKEYKIDAELGPLQIAYTEAAINKITDAATINTKIGSNKQSLTVKLSIIPTNKPVSDVMKLDKKAEAASNIASIFPKHLQSIRQGIEVALAHGPKIGSRIVNTEVMLHWFEVTRGTSDTVISASVTQLLQKMLKESGTNILEPVMFLEIVTPDDCLSVIMADLSRRRSEMHDVTVRGNMKVVSVSVPLAELLGYSTILRTIASGTATFTMDFSQYQSMSAVDESRAIKSVRGF